MGIAINIMLRSMAPSTMRPPGRACCSKTSCCFGSSASDMFRKPSVTKLINKICMALSGKAKPKVMANKITKISAMLVEKKYKITRLSV